MFSVEILKTELECGNTKIKHFSLEKSFVDEKKDLYKNNLNQLLNKIKNDENIITLTFISLKFNNF